MLQFKFAFFLGFILLNTYVFSQNREMNYFENISFDSLVELRRGDSLTYVKKLKQLSPQSSFELVDSFFNKIFLSRLWGSYENYIYAETLIVTLNAIESNIQRDSTKRRFWLFVRRGFCKYIHSDYALSMIDLNSAINENPEHPYPYWFRGLVKYERKDYYGAIEDLKNSVSRITDDDYVKFNCIMKSAKIFEELKNFGRAVELYTDALKIDPENCGIYLRRGELKTLIGQKYQACLDLSKAGELGCEEAYDFIEKHCN